MKYEIINRRVYIPGLNKLYKSIVETLSIFYHKFIKDGLSVLPLSVRLIKAKASV
jgi:hypothetical protein